MFNKYFISFIICISLITSGCKIEKDEAIIKDRLEKIAKYKEVPMKDGYMEWPEYRDIVNIGTKANDILLKLMISDKDTSIVFYGRKEKIGDICFYLLLKINILKATDVLPETVAKQWLEVGSFAYYDFVADRKNRKIIKNNFEKVLKSKK